MPLPTPRAATRWAFLGRVSTEDAQDPEASRAWQIDVAQRAVDDVGGTIVREFFDIDVSRSVPWKRRPQAARLLAEIRDTNRSFDDVVIAEPSRAFYGTSYSDISPLLNALNVLLVPSIGIVDYDNDSQELILSVMGGMSKSERKRTQARTKAAMNALARSKDRVYHLGGRPPVRVPAPGRRPPPAPGQESRRSARPPPGGRPRVRTGRPAHLRPVRPRGEPGTDRPHPDR
jgi:site-specific DNA recombinase